MHQLCSAGLSSIGVPCTEAGVSLLRAKQNETSAMKWEGSGTVETPAATSKTPLQK